ncbi:PE-PPE domain-containing protein [Streptomyces sp. cf386]|uniref:cutinase family protein n=1 Tax=Streptomyces sp. cf386 TaxID=1761904 RepID=UPI00088BE5CD|nr:PE-PPE domain-containing protein [Streptomyces sp. cf386]SDO05695.1 PE-PPE domain-containing protein [Streptomyces sp. cf386]
MSSTSRLARAVGVAATTAALAVGTAVAFPSAAQAADAEHYYIQIGGTGPTKSRPGCDTATDSYDRANQALNLGSSAVPVCYPASAGPLIGPHGGLVDGLNVNPDALTAPTYDSSVQKGYQAALETAKETHRRHPAAHLTITGYSQGAQIADEVLQTIAAGSTGIPLSQVDGVLYADPMQPDTGLGAKIPKGVGIPGVATSPGVGPAEFNGIPVARYCITADPVCDLRSPLNAPGYFNLHWKYPEFVIPQTLAEHGTHGVYWRKADGSAE